MDWRKDSGMGKTKITHCEWRGECDVLCWTLELAVRTGGLWSWGTRVHLYFVDEDIGLESHSKLVAKLGLNFGLLAYGSTVIRELKDQISFTLPTLRRELKDQRRGKVRGHTYSKRFKLTTYSEQDTPKNWGSLSEKRCRVEVLGTKDSELPLSTQEHQSQPRKMYFQIRVEFSVWKFIFQIGTELLVRAACVPGTRRAAKS